MSSLRIDAAPFMNHNGHTLFGGIIVKVVIEKCENGFTVECQCDPPVSKGSTPPAYEEPKVYVAATIDAACVQAKKCMSGNMSSRKQS